MSSSVPSLDDFIQSFPDQLTKIEGIPSYKTLSILCELVKANAGSVPTTRGGGKLGYLVLVVSMAIYKTISATPWTIPDYPDTRPIIPPATTSTPIGDLVRQHQKPTPMTRISTNRSGFPRHRTHLPPSQTQPSHCILQHQPL